MSSSTQPLTWLVTGASSGIGHAICNAALAAGHKVAGATRDVAKASAANPDFAARGGIWVTLDPGHPDSAAAFAAVDKELGGVDVLVNNAGYWYLAGIEDMSESLLRQQMEVNFFGPMRGVRTLLPAMRARGGGHIVLISSGAGFTGRASRGAYAASKWASEAMHEVLSREVGDKLGIKVLIVEPGGFRTTFTSRGVVDTNFNEAYKGTELDNAITLVSNWDEDGLDKYFRGDTAKAARAILNAIVDGHDEYLRLVLGPDCVAAMEQKIRELQRDLDATREVSMSTNLDNA
ncbi:putative glucose ribitol dehydrogenase [Rosellinia necatrix]|uniref:Putative glucose ribitol dehydrogenase n=1 Tax=Rosellinia necatrix TaxID=77044 RepID=A0A1S7UJ03_ROSNE|nr:putative glucose ribitol dehydrogenase [Rosellinia necatrix]